MKMDLQSRVIRPRLPKPAPTPKYQTIRKCIINMRNVVYFIVLINLVNMSS